MTDFNLDQLLRVPGLTFKAAGPVLGTDNIAESALRLCQLDSGQRHQGASQLLVVKRITYFARGALGISTHYPDIGPKTVAYQSMVTRSVTLDKIAQREHVAKGLTMRQAVMRIVDNYRIARNHYVLHTDVVDPPVPVARENETEAALATRQRFDFALREMWGVLGQLQDLMTVSGKKTLAAKQALAQEKKEHLTSRDKFMAAEKKATILQSENEDSKKENKDLEKENEDLKKENDDLEKESDGLKKDGMYAMSAIEAFEDRGISEDGLNELEAIPQ
ncbi:unnamed protein product [Colletotrichum noveboracense]|uniref:Uncharacterized protein n=1 Tax=Colletotrichum noveboracense TaxID=2664923 RepID=A0A9W4S4A8_9PEZI|nr:hypothetical protein K456DRAFT_1725583 [Colletotrichum gloeosporioides 23]CAI0652207.1 unnamed protein product [Colletotrichum noveboracense]